jgi:acetoin utilization protein AcuB
MLIRQAMTKRPVTVQSNVSVSAALELMHEKGVHRLPVLDRRGRMVGIVAESDLLYASPSPATSLSVWEIHGLLAKLTVEKVMTRKVITISPDAPVEEAAQTMVTKQIGGLPVLDGKELVGIVTETDLFKVFIDMLGGRRHGVRVYATIPGKKGSFMKIAQAVYKAGGDIVGLGLREAAEASGKVWEMTIKVKDLPRNKLVAALKPVVNKFKDARST